jgi:uncharacterized membrane protein YkoI
MRKYLQIAASLGMVAAPVVANPALAYTGDKYASEAKISMAQAIAIALHAQPGTVTDKELEREKGGSGLRYSFDVRTSSGMREVGVDAVTGAVLEVSAEGPNAD